GVAVAVPPPEPAPSAGANPTRARSATVRRSGLADRAAGGDVSSIGRPDETSRPRVQLLESLQAGEDPTLAVVEPLVDVERKDVPAPSRADPEGDGHRVLALHACRNT